MDTHLEDGDTSNDGDVDMNMNGMNMDFDEEMNMDFDEEMDMDADMDMDMDTDMDMSMDMGGMDMMGMDMGSMMGGGMPGSDAEAIGMSKSMAPDMQCDVTSKFDYVNGMFDKVYGTVTTDINTMGVKMNVVSHISMVLNK
jgi:hypothetical protein